MRKLALVPYLIIDELIKSESPGQRLAAVVPKNLSYKGHQVLADAFKMTLPVVGF